MIVIAVVKTRRTEAVREKKARMQNGRSAVIKWYRLPEK